MRNFKDKTITIKKKFDSYDWACFHDSILDACGKSYTQNKLEKLFEELPEHIRMTAIEWGMNDTVFGDQVYVHFEPKPKVKAEHENTNGRKPLLIIKTGMKGVGKQKIWDGVSVVRLLGKRK